MTSHYTQGPMIMLHDFGSALGRPLGTSFGLSQFHGHGSWLMCDVALSLTGNGCYIPTLWVPMFRIVAVVTPPHTIALCKSGSNLY